MESTSMEDLPSEIKIFILHELADLSTLDALVHASPTFHAVYRSERKHVLSAIIFKTIQQSVMLDAIGALLAFRHQEDMVRHVKPQKEFVEGFLSQYSQLRALVEPWKFDFECESDTEDHTQQVVFSSYLKDGIRFFSSFIPITEENLIQIARLHKIVLAISEDMVQSCLEFLPFTKQPLQEKLFLSPHEARRVQRALYRIEIFRLLFADWIDPIFFIQCLVFQRTSSWPTRIDEVYQVNCFFSIFSPWEIEEIACARCYIYRVYSSVTDEVMRFRCDAGCEMTLDQWIIQSIKWRPGTSRGGNSRQKEKSLQDGLSDVGSSSSTNKFTHSPCSLRGVELEVPDSSIYQVEEALPRASQGLEGEEHSQNRLDALESPPATTRLSNEMMIEDHHQEHCMALGLSFLYNWLRTPLECNDAYAAVPGHICPITPFLTEALLYGGDLCYEDYYMSSVDTFDFVSDADWYRPNEAWTWSVDPVMLLYPRPWAWDLQRWGYVFWDHDRLKELDVEEKVKKLFLQYNFTTELYKYSEGCVTTVYQNICRKKGVENEKRGKKEYDSLTMEYDLKYILRLRREIHALTISFALSCPAK